jgi:hypothetical protein
MRTEEAREKAREEVAAAPNPALERVRGAKADTDVERKTAESIAVVFIVQVEVLMGGMLQEL